MPSVFDSFDVILSGQGHDEHIKWNRGKWAYQDGQDRCENDGPACFVCFLSDEMTQRQKDCTVRILVLELKQAYNISYFS